MCGVQVKDIKIYMDLMIMLVLNEIDRLAMANSVHWYGHVMGKEDGQVLRRAFDFEAEGQLKNWRSKRTGRSTLRKKV